MLFISENRLLVQKYLTKNKAIKKTGIMNVSNQFFGNLNEPKFMELSN